MLKKIFIKAIFLFGVCNQASAADYIATGSITTVRIHSAQNGLTSVRGVTAFKLSTQLSGNCLWLIITADDKNTLAHFMAAQAVGKNVSVYYTDSISVPWGDTQSCYVTVIDR